jgi:uncharacterized membrane protein
MSKHDLHVTGFLALMPLRAFILAAALAVGVGSCGGGDSPLPTVDCLAGPVPTFSEVTIWNRCLGCHSTVITGADRTGAPTNVNFDMYADAVASAEEAAREVHSGRMPKGDTATAAEKESLYRWALCGTPQ